MQQHLIKEPIKISELVRAWKEMSQAITEGQIGIIAAIDEIEGMWNNGKEALSWRSLLCSLGTYSN